VEHKRSAHRLIETDPGPRPGEQIAELNTLKPQFRGKISQNLAPFSISEYAMTDR
jgi:hypothetical protein